MLRRSTRQESYAAAAVNETPQALQRRRQRKRPGAVWACVGRTCARLAPVTVLATLSLFIAVQQGYFANHKNDHRNPRPWRVPSLSQLRGRSAVARESHPAFPAYPLIHRTTVRPELLDMCTRTLWHTLETTTVVLPDGDTFIHTGDIDDLWLRDSASQIHPLLVGSSPLIASDERLDRIVAGLIRRVAMYIRHDPYANAFRIDDTYVFSDSQKAMGRHDLISTWNYELDSACFYLRLLFFYWKQSPLGPTPESVLRLPAVQEAVEIMVDLWIAEQEHELDRYPQGPLFDCLNCRKPYRYPGLDREGKGSPTNATAGMTWTGFRPSDDECQYHYLVPANMFAVVVLRYVVAMAREVWDNEDLALKAGQLAHEIDQGIQNHGIVEHPIFGKVYAYEVDGLGNYNVMDDANVPSLLSAPYLGYAVNDTVYRNTQKLIFSTANPTYRKGTNALTGDIEGYGSVHMEAAIPDNIWPMALAVQGLVSDSVEQKIELAETLYKASAGTGWMHESFDVNNPSRFTRSWFCWADSLFAELVMSITENCPLPSHKYRVHDWRDPVVVPGGVYAAD